MSTPRVPVTPHETSVISSLSTEISKSETFFCQGKIDVGVARPALLYLPHKDATNAKAVIFPNPPVITLDALHADFRPSHFGHGKETVMDESYRLARELLSDSFNLNFDPLSPRTGVVPSIAAFCKTGVEVALYKINSYTTGGLFKAHTDTPKGTNHLGTLLLGLPTPHSGGELLLRKDDDTVTVDWSTEGRHGNQDFLWTFFYSDVEHEIMPVTSGHRLTIAYDVYSSTAVTYTAPANMQAIDIKTSPLYRALKAMVDDHEFLPNGGRLAFGLSYQYPAMDMQTAEVFNAILKGSDNILWHCLIALGCTVDVKAVYRMKHYASENIKEVDEVENDEVLVEGEEGDERSDDDSDSEENVDDQTDGTDSDKLNDRKSRYRSKIRWRYPFNLIKIPYPRSIDEFSSVGPAKHGERAILMTAKSFTGVDEDSCEYEGESMFTELLQQSTRAKIEQDLIWIKKPAKYAKNENFVSHWGNEPCTASSYVAGALIATLVR